MKTEYILQKKTDKGLKRDRNEDSVIVYNHPDDEAIKLLAVADGMGGKHYGDIASRFVIEGLYQWFVLAELSLLNDTSVVSQELKDLIFEFNEQLVQKYGENCVGTTLTLALVNQSKTIILNIGDSRCYAYHNKNLLQITEDDSEVWAYYKYGQVDKEDLRYFSTSNIISACIGLNYELCRPAVIVRDNNSYELLLLLTDGITDLLTDEKIKFLIHNNRKDQIIDELVKQAVYIDQDLHVPLKLRYRYVEPFLIPEHGKDNASAAIFIKN